ncbi:MAG: hypothetical protein EAY65_05610 [Alphaproteobacteria bacterium]|nr:MAG: hypothetical protein EAY65_05610 [Alphaproteobacteria bacterium]
MNEEDEEYHSNITDIALRTLQRKNPNIDYVTDEVAKHDPIHLIAHPSFNGDLTQPQPSINTSEHGETIVRITELVLCGYKGFYDEHGDFVRARPEDDFLQRSPEEVEKLRDYLGVQELIMSEHPLTFAEIKQELIHAEIREKRLDKLWNASCSQEKDEARIELKKPYKDFEGEIDLGLTDQAIEYYMVRANLIKEQLEQAGVLDKMRDSRINEIDPNLFVVSKEAVIEALEAKHHINSQNGERFSIKTPIPCTTIATLEMQHEPPLMKQQAKGFSL